MADNSEALPQHIESTVHTIALLHEQQYREASRIQQKIEHTTALIGRPRVVIVLTVCVTIWIVGNVTVMLIGARPPDMPPFPWLNLFVSAMAFYVTILILTTQRREDKLAASRAQLTLELAILSEQKTAKIIQMLEAVRHDSPHLDNKVDREAHEMAMPSNPEDVLNAINQTHSDLASQDVLND